MTWPFVPFGPWKKWTGFAAEDTRNQDFCSSILTFPPSRSVSRAQCQGKNSWLDWFLRSGQKYCSGFWCAGLPSISDPWSRSSQVTIEVAVVTVQVLVQGFCLDCQWFSATTTYLLVSYQIRPTKTIFDSKDPKLRFSKIPTVYVADGLENMLTNAIYGDSSGGLGEV